MKSRLERLLEAGVYAPVGFLVTRSKTVPDLAAAGRKQIAFARSLGQAALKGFGRTMGRDDPPALIHTPAAERVVAASTDDRLSRGADVVLPDAVNLSDDAAAPTAVTAPARSSTAPKAPVVAAESAGVAEGTAEVEGVADYDRLTAREIVELLRSADQPKAQWIHGYESGHKERVTVLRAAAKLLD